MVLPNVAVFSTRRYSHCFESVYRRIPSTPVFSLSLSTRTASLYLILLALLLLPSYSISSACACISGSSRLPLLRRVAFICKYGDLRRPVKSTLYRLTQRSHANTYSTSTTCCLPYTLASLRLFSLQGLGELFHPWQEVSALHIWPENLWDNHALRSSSSVAITVMTIG